MGIYLGDRELESFSKRVPDNPFYVPQRATSVWVGNRKVYPPSGRELVLEFTPTSWDSEHVISMRNFPGAQREFTLRVPWWVTFVDYVLIGAGNGGNGGDGTRSRHGTGGRSSPWVSGTMTRLREGVVVRAGYGGEGAPERERTGSLGGNSTLRLNPLPPEVPLSRPGAQPSGYGDHWGQSPGNHTAFGRTFIGGSGGDRGNPGFPGSAPGAGGGGGNGGTFGAGRPGGRGGDGYVWIRFRSD